MKIKKITEKINEDVNRYEWYHLALYNYFFRDENVFFNLLALDEQISSFGEFVLRISLDIFIDDLEPELLYKIAKYNKFMREHGSYRYLVAVEEDRENYIILQIDIPKSKFENFEDDLIKIGGFKFHPEINKYNL